MTTMQEIVPNLWLGSLVAVREVVNTERVGGAGDNSNNDPRTNCAYLRHWTVVSILDSPSLVNLTQQMLKEWIDAGRCTHIVWKLPDTCQAPFLSTTLETILQQIDEGIRTADDGTFTTNNACLIHCAKGVSRSASTCAAWLMTRKRQDCPTVQEALKWIRNKGRTQVSPNMGFLASLRALEQCHGDILKAMIRMNRLERNSDIFEVAIIGSGPAGLVSAKSLLDQGVSNIVVLEETSCAGGLWNKEGDDRDQSSGLSSTRVTPPCVIRHRETEEAILKVASSCQPVYDNLRSNFPKDMTSFIGHPFPSTIEHFPDATTVASYYQGYGKRFGVDKRTRYQCRVEECVKNSNTGIWEIRTKSTSTGETDVVQSRRLLVCNGHFRKAFAPYIPGIEDFTGQVLHSSAFTSPRDFQNKTILIIGGGISGADIAKMLLAFRTVKDHGVSHASGVIMSVRNWKLPQDVLLPRLQKKYGLVVRPGIDRIEKDGSVRFRDIRYAGDQAKTRHKYSAESVHSLVKPDVILFATGYRYHFPFFKETSGFLRNDGYKMEGLYKRVLPLCDFSLAFVGITNVNFSPALVMEYQARWYAKMVVKDGGRSLDKEAMKREIKLRENDQTQDALALQFPSYCNSLSKDIGVSGYWTQLICYRFHLFVRTCWARASMKTRRVVGASCVAIVVPILRIIYGARYNNTTPKI